MSLERQRFAMAVISNDFSRFQIVNLHDDTPGRGPFMVTQHGSLPDDVMLAEHDFMLACSGEWVEWTEVLGGGPELVEEVVFDTVQQVLETVERLVGAVRVRRESRRPEEVMAQITRVESNGGIREEIRRMLVQRLERRAAR